MPHDYYEVLGVDSAATASQIKRAFRRLARELHPDRNPGDCEKERAFKRLAEAYRVLSCPVRRREYDCESLMGDSGVDGFAAGFDFDAVMDSAIGGFEDIFGGTRRARRRKRTPCPEVHLEFMEALLGTVVHGCTEDGESFAARAPAGSQNGDRLCGYLKGSGEELSVLLAVGDHPLLKWQGDALVMQLPLTCAEAYTGTCLEVETCAGSVKVRVPAGVRSGQKLRLRGKGPAREGRHGDLLLCLEVKLPPPGNAEVDAAFRRCELAYCDLRAEMPRFGGGKVSRETQSKPRPDVARPGAGGADVARADVGRADVARADAARPAVAQPVVVQTSVAQPAVVQTSVAQPSVAQPSVAQPSVAQPSVARPAVTRPAVAQPEVNRPDVARATPPEAPVVTTE